MPREARAHEQQVDDNKIDSFDDLFEPFDLDDAPPAEEEAEPEVVTVQTDTVACPSCGTQNPASNHHCEACGARIAQGPLPVAPQPILRTTPGARALGVLAGVILVVALIALIVNVFRGDDEESPSLTTTSTPTTGAPLAVERLKPTRVQASSELTGFPASALIDDDPTNSWNDQSAAGVDAELEFFFAQPVQITSIVVQNIDNEERFRRNYRIEALEIITNDLPPTFHTLEDHNAAQQIDLANVRTTSVKLRVISTYPAEAVGDSLPFQELALQEIRFFGRIGE